MLVANEAVEEFRERKKEGLVVEIDFEKAYDHGTWGLLEVVLEIKKVLGNDGENGWMDVFSPQIFMHDQW